MNGMVDIFKAILCQEKCKMEPSIMSDLCSKLIGVLNEFVEENGGVSPIDSYHITSFFQYAVLSSILEEMPMETKMGMLFYADELMEKGVSELIDEMEAE